MATSDFLHEATQRGFIADCTDIEGLDAAMRAGPVSGYIGYDLTADSLHVGHMVQIMLLRLLQRHGHTPVALMGGGTSKIGDPSFREEARQMLKEEQILANMQGIQANIAPFLRFGEAPGDAIMPNNADWLDKLGYIQLLREVGVHFSVSRMLALDSVKNRLEREQGLTFLEFNYSILQAYDFRELNRRHGVTLQMGGSDQWGNIVSGVDLVRRMDAKKVFGLTTQLITTASGAKMGKTAGGAVWLTASKLPVFDYWQFWRNTEDADVGRFLRLFTDFPLEEIARLEKLGGAEINEAKKVLATAATALAHGQEKAELAAQAAQVNFSQTIVSGNTSQFPVDTTLNPGPAKLTIQGFAPTISTGLPEVHVKLAELPDPIPVHRIFVIAGLATSNAEARRLIRGGGARLNNAVINDEQMALSHSQLRDGMKVSAGRKQHRMVVGA